MSHAYIDKIKKARVYEVATKTPLTKAVKMSRHFGNEVLFKREDLQSVFSFKLRGAYNKIALLSDVERRAGVVAASAGNHAQGVALACKEFGVTADIVMPETTPMIKVEAVRDTFGANVVRYGDTYDQACERARALCEERGKTFIHPYDDPDVIAGQGTIGMEIHEQRPDVNVVFVPVGGGGLIAGVAVWLKHHLPEVEIVGVEPEDSACLHAALAAGEPVDLEKVGLFADGVAVKRIGDEPFAVARDLVDEVVRVTTDEICAAIKYVYDDTRVLSEPAGALSVAGMRKYLKARHYKPRDRVLLPILSGANMNFDRLVHIVERYEVGANIESLFAVTIPEVPGSFKKFCRLLGRHAITEFNYRYADNHAAQVFVGVRFEHADKEQVALMRRLGDEGYEVVDLSGDKMSKLHLRHMIGGHAPQATDERIYRFIFPERPMALLGFLESLKQDWNISLFHYRNHGAAYGRVLLGIQVPEKEVEQLHAFFDSTGYTWEDENDNPAYALFLR